MTVKVCRTVLRRPKEELLSQLLRSFHNFPKEGDQKFQENTKCSGWYNSNRLWGGQDLSISVQRCILGHKEEEAYGFSFSATNECQSILIWGDRTRNGNKGTPQGMTPFNLLFLKLVQQAQAGICACELHSASGTAAASEQAPNTWITFYICICGEGEKKVTLHRRQW